MGQVIASASMSLDGFVAYDDDTPRGLFDWYDAGDVEVRNAGDLPAFRLSAESAAYWTEFVGSLGALLVGRRLFDITDGWGGTHPLDVPVVVLTHSPPTDWSPPGSERFHFVTEGIGAAVAKARELAGEGSVSVAAGTVASQALAAGLVDVVNVELVPVLVRSGRPYFTDALDAASLRLGDPTVVAAHHVTHLSFPVLDR